MPHESRIGKILWPTRLLIVLALSCFFSVWSIPKGSTGKQQGGVVSGQWSSVASDLCPGEDSAIPEESRNLSVNAFSRETVFHVVNGRWWVTVNGKPQSLNSKHSHVGCPADVGWSPDSKALYITQSDGEIAGFHTEVFLLADRLEELTPGINSVIERDFTRDHGCIQRIKGKLVTEEPNIAGLRWVRDHDQLLLVAEVRPDSLCGHRGYFAGYLLEIPTGKIIERYSPGELNRQWAADLGVRLKGDFEGLAVKERDMKP